MSEDTITMTKREVERYQTIQRFLSGEMTQARTGEWLGLSERQIRRLVKRVRAKGMRGLTHGNRGRCSPRRMSEAEEARIAAIISERYPDFTPLHVAEKLWERRASKYIPPPTHPWKRVPFRQIPNRTFSLCVDIVQPTLTSSERGFILVREGRRGFRRESESAQGTVPKSKSLVARSGNIYFTGRVLTERTPAIFLCRFSESRYAPPEKPACPIAELPLLDPWVDPDENFLLVSLPSPQGPSKPFDIGIVFHQPDGTWNKPVRLGGPVNTEAVERFPSLARDGKYLFFIRSYSPGFVGDQAHFYWVDANVLKGLRPKERQ